ncbi:amidase family protein [Cohnella panacarvi]|uniref:amidase family protein n=1 Tax=Cohnella panacarvi TaxID=400776 RepID=UPI00047C1EF6|nr:amidase family protein [Cohnella panacarvi]
MRNQIEQWLSETDIAAMQAAMEAGEISSEDLVRGYLGRIEKFDPRINAVLEINPDATAIARGLDEERAARGSRGPLHGIPVLLKDNIDTGDLMHTSAGSVALADSIARGDAFIAARLREAGAVILGKANMTEWSNFMSSRMPAGYSSRGGQVINPYGADVFVSGSSSGPAAATAASFAAAAIGTETAGSIVGPASQHNVVGIKPTVGLLSRSGIIPISSSQDTAGPIARSVADAAIVLGAMTGLDERDPAMRTAARRDCADYTPFLDADFLKQARIGIPRHYYNHLDAERLALMETAIADLRSAGAAVIDPVELYIEQLPWNNDVITYEFKRGINAYLSELPPSAPVRSLSQLIAYNGQHAETAARYGQDVLELSEANTLTEEEYARKKQEYSVLARTRGIDYVLEQHRLDALMLPGDVDGMYIAARLGYPLISVPAGFVRKGTIDADGDPTKGPFGVVFSAGAYSEPTLIKIAYGYEQATRHHAPFILKEV